MSTLKPTKKISRKHELREDKVVTVYAKALQYFDGNKPIVYGIGVALLLFIAALFGFRYLQGQNQESAVVEMASAVRQFEQGNFQAALDGFEGEKGLVSLIDEYGRTDAGNLAKFYAADAHFRLGQYDESLEYFSDYKIEADYIGASALAGQAAIHELRGDFERAGDLFVRAAQLFESDVTSPGYLLDAARSYVQGGQLNDAIAVYDEIDESYKDTPEAQQTDVLRAEAIVRAG